MRKTQGYKDWDKCEKNYIGMGNVLNNYVNGYVKWDVVRRDFDGNEQARLKAHGAGRTENRLTVIIMNFEFLVLFLDTDWTDPHRLEENFFY
jgi:hypothetical protein